MSRVIAAKLRKLRHPRTARELGQGMIEYAVIIALISVAALGVIVLIGPHIGDVFSQAQQALCSASGQAIHHDWNGCGEHR